MVVGVQHLGILSQHNEECRLVALTHSSPQCNARYLICLMLHWIRPGLLRQVMKKDRNAVEEKKQRAKAAKDWRDKASGRAKPQTAVKGYMPHLCTITMACLGPAWQAQR